jgi:hypothetical protein
LHLLDIVQRKDSQMVFRKPCWVGHFGLHTPSLALHVQLGAHLGCEQKLACEILRVTCSFQHAGTTNPGAAAQPKLLNRPKAAAEAAGSGAADGLAGRTSPGSGGAAVGDGAFQISGEVGAGAGRFELLGLTAQRFCVAGVNRPLLSRLQK